MNDAGWGFFLCTYKEVRAGRSGSEFVILNLQDASGQATAKIMSDVERFKSEFDAGDFVRAEGKGSLYNGQVQLVLSTLRRVNPDQDRLQGFGIITSRKISVTPGDVLPLTSTNNLSISFSLSSTIS